MGSFHKKIYVVSSAVKKNTFEAARYEGVFSFLSLFVLGGVDEGLVRFFEGSSSMLIFEMLILTSIIIIEIIKMMW